MTRSEARKGFDPEVRIALAEGDIDKIESAVTSIDRKLHRLIVAAASLSLTFGTSAVLLAINLVVST